MTAAATDRAGKRQKVVGRIAPAPGGGRQARSRSSLTIEFSGRDLAAAMIGTPVDHVLWTLEKRTHRVECRVRATPFGPELRIVLDGELFWSSVIRPAPSDALTDAAETKRGEFEAKGWRRPGPREVGDGGL